MKKALVIGSTGLVGKSLVNQLISSGNYSQITAIVRKKNSFDNSKITELVVDFDNMETLEFQADHIFCCLGTTIKTAGSKEAFRKVDHDYPIAFARKGLKSNTQLFAIVTAMGASAKSSIFYNRVKGQVENELSQLAYPHLGIFRPSMLLGDRNEARLGEKIGKQFMKLFEFIIPAKYKAIHVDTVARAMIKYAKKPGKGITIEENDAMLALD